MAGPLPVTQTIVTYVKNGVNLDDFADSPAKKAFLELTETIKAQEGCLCQYWGHQVEHPDLFVWCIDWESIERYTQCPNSVTDNAFKALFDQAFEIGEEPLMILTTWTAYAESAFQSKVTEVAFYTLPNGATQAAKADIEESLKPIDVNVQRVGKATGAATGWAFDVRNPGEEWLHGVYGYDSIEDHMTWRQQPEHEMAMQLMRGLEERLVIFKVADVAGLDPVTGYFHVKFRRGD